jgi:hypothetical protein
MKILHHLLYDPVPNNSISTKIKIQNVPNGLLPRYSTEIFSEIQFDT